jgi:Protein of unknown function (DUF4231)
MGDELPYIKDRLDEQAQWHSNKATWNRRRFYAAEIIALAGGALIPIVNASNLPDALVRMSSAVLGAIVVIAVGTAKLYKFQENWLSYRALAEALNREKELYTYGASDYEGAGGDRRDRLLVERVENMLASATSQYVSLHRSEERGATESQPDADKQGQENTPGN